MSPAYTANETHPLFIPKVACDRDLVVALDVHDLHASAPARKKRGGEALTVHNPCALNVLRNSGSPSAALSFSYLSSSASFWENNTSAAIYGQIRQTHEGKDTHKHPLKNEAVSLKKRAWLPWTVPHAQKGAPFLHCGVPDAQRPSTISKQAGQEHVTLTWP